MAQRRMHDMGGLEAGPIDRREHEPTLVERRIDAMMMILRDKPHALWKTDENRRTIEGLPPELYDGGAYYQRWVEAMRRLLVEKGVLSDAETDARLAEVRARHRSAAEGGS
ncbi:hypothetical protein AY599_10120 [Leptolyngbya valderiana BDU 20041]|nr:hypothetical protein AY599_10120 [Leptolyngbya valderiana BDU 20041]